MNEVLIALELLSMMVFFGIIEEMYMEDCQCRTW